MSILKCPLSMSVCVTLFGSITAGSTDGFLASTAGNATIELLRICSDGVAFDECTIQGGGDMQGK